ncbi:MAG TPA: hypothetical protein VI454_19485, partial [Verrucomicrobiae bacterium]
MSDRPPARSLRTKKSDFTLESVTTLGEVNRWTPVPNPPAIVDDQYTISVSTPDATGFFRLRASGP